MWFAKSCNKTNEQRNNCHTYIFPALMTLLWILDQFFFDGITQNDQSLPHLERQQIFFKKAYLLVLMWNSASTQHQEIKAECVQHIWEQTGDVYLFLALRKKKYNQRFIMQHVCVNPFCSQLTLSLTNTHTHMQGSSSLLMEWRVVWAHVYSLLLGRKTAGSRTESLGSQSETCGLYFTSPIFLASVS